MNESPLQHQLYQHCIKNLDRECAPLITNESCGEYLKFFQNNCDTAYLFLVTYPSEIATKTGMKFYLAKRILEDASLNLIVCQGRVDLLLKLMHETGLNYEFSYQCLLEFKWNFPEAKAKVVKMKNNGEIPPRGFLNYQPPQQAINVSVPNSSVQVPTMISQQPNIPHQQAINPQSPPQFVQIIQSNTSPFQSVKQETNERTFTSNTSLHTLDVKSEAESSTQSTTSKQCQYPGCTKEIEKSRKKYCAEHGAKPLKKESMSVDFIKCQHAGCTNPIAKYRKKYCELHGNKK